MTIKLSPVSTSEDIAVVSCLARRIWPPHFTPIIGAPQVEYMLERFQSVHAVASQIDDGWDYFLAMLEGEPVGYTGLVPEPDRGRLMLNKLYVVESARGKGVGSSLLAFAERRCRLAGGATLWLTVNRFNRGPIAWYRQRGFVTVEEVKKDIGGGFFMDDYVMEKRITE